MGYDAAMCYVYTTNEESKARNDIRAFKGAKTISESVRYTKYQSSVKNSEEFKNSFETYLQFDNSANFDKLNEDMQNEICSDLVIMGGEIGAFFEGRQKAFPKSHDAPKVPATSEPKGEPIIAGYERVKKNGFWVLQPKGGIKREEVDLDAMFENYSASANDDSNGNINAPASNSPTENPQTVIAKNKNVGKFSKAKKKTASPPPNYFDSRLGIVPSGGVGLVSSDYQPTHGKTISELRGKLK
jgi:hypothetical protein